MTETPNVSKTLNLVAFGKKRHVNLRKSSASRGLAVGVPGIPAVRSENRQKRTSLPAHRPGVQATPGHPGGFQKFHGSFSYVPFLLPVPSKDTAMWCTCRTRTKALQSSNSYNWWDNSQLNMRTTLWNTVVHRILIYNCALFREVFQNIFWSCINTSPSERLFSLACVSCGSWTHVMLQS